MTETPILGLPLVQPAQAQKHVTVNEALARLDGVTQLALISISQTTPPAAVVGGAVYGVPSGAVNAWSGQDGNIALAINGGWVFVQPKIGWRAMVMDAGCEAIYDGSDWRLGAQTLTPGGAGLKLRSMEFDVNLVAGASASTPIAFPARSIAFGVTGRVTSEITGTASAWDLGIVGDTGRYGTGLGTAPNSWVNGPGAPTVYWTPTPLEITAQGGDFAGGSMRLIAHFAELSLPFPI
jgi:hypothetical protein